MSGATKFRPDRFTELVVNNEARLENCWNAHNEENADLHIVIVRALSRGMGFSFANLCFLMIHLTVLPYRQSSFNHMESTSLFLLALLSCLLTRYGAPYDNDVQIGIFLIVGIPAILMACFII